MSPGHSSRHSFRFSFLAIGIALLGTLSLAGEADLSRLRRVYVPFADLQTALKHDADQVILSREEFEHLLKRGIEDQKRGAPQAPILTSAEFQIHEHSGQLLANATVQIASFSSFGEADLSIAGWNVLSGQINEQPARMCRTGQDLNTLRVFLPDSGSHELRLRLSCSLQQAGSDQLASVGLIGAAAEEWRMTLPAGRFLRVDQQDLERPADDHEQAEYSLPVGGRKQLELMITSRRSNSQGDVLTFANTAYGIQVSPGEIRWSAQTELQVFGRKLDRIIGTVPRALEITGVESAGLESWELSDDKDPGRTRLTLTYRQAFDGPRTILFRGLLSQSPQEPWQVPDLALPEVTSNTGVIVIRHPEQVRLQVLESRGVQPISQAPAAEKLFDQPAQQLFAIWQPDFQLQFLTQIRDRQVQAAMTNLLTLSEQDLDLSCTATLDTRQAPLFEARIRIPAEYQVARTMVDGQPAEWQTVSEAAGINEIRIPLKPPLSPGQSRTVSLLAQNHPEGWPVSTAPLTLALPEVRLPQAAMLEGVYGIAASDDFEIVPLEVSGLDPAARSTRERLQQASAGLRLAYTSQDTVFSGKLQISRRPSLLTAKVITVFRVDPQTQFAHLEAVLAVQGGGLRQLIVQVSEAAGDRLRFQLSPRGPQVQPARLIEQLPGELANGMRTWKLNFDRYLQGEYVLSTEVELPRGEETSFAVPQLAIAQAEAQTGFVAIEAAPDELVRIDAKSADQQPLATVDPVDFPSASYQARQRIVAGFRYQQSGWSITISPTRFQREAVPGAIGQRITTSSVWDGNAPLQHRTELDFNAVGMQSLLIHLPEGAELWSTLMDGKPFEARTSAGGIHLPLSRLNAAQPHRLELFYATPPRQQDHQGELQLVPPTFAVIAGTGQEQTLSILKQTWQLHYPRETKLTGSMGDFRPLGKNFDESWPNRLNRFWHRVDRFDIFSILVVAAVGTFVAWGLIRLWRNSRRWDLRAILGTVILLGVFAAVLMVGLPALRQALAPARQGIAANATVNLALPTEPIPTAEPELRSEEKASQDGLTDPFTKMRKSGLANAKPEQERLGKGVRRMEAPPAAPERSSSELAQSGNRPESFAIPPAAASPEPSPESTLGKDVRLQESGDSSQAGDARQGLLSVAMALEIPDQLRQQNFEYLGNGTAEGPAEVRVHFSNRTTNRLLRWTVAFGFTLLGWWLRGTALRFRLFWAFITIFVPLGLLGLVPPLWQPACEGILMGGVLSALLWLLSRCAASCCRVDRGLSHVCLFLVAALLCISESAHADEPASPPSSDGPYVIIPYESADSREQANRVWLPAKLYQKLWALEHPEAFPSPASIPAMIAEARYQARFNDAEKGTPKISITARWVAVSLSDEPLQLPLPISRVAIRDAQVDGSAALLSAERTGEIRILLSKRGVHTIKAMLDVPLTGSLDGGRFSIETVPVGSGSLMFELPPAKSPLTVDVNGITKLDHHDDNGDAPYVEIPIDRGGTLTVNWQPERSSAVNNLIQAESGTAIVVGKGGIEVNTASLVRVRQGTARELTMEIPAGFSLQDVSGKDVAGWEIRNHDSRRELHLSLRRDVSDEVRLNVQLFKSLTIEDRPTTLTLEAPRLHGMARDSGEIAVFAPEELRLRLNSMQGLQQIDTAQFHPSIMPLRPKEKPQLAFKRSGDAPTLKIDVSRREAETRGTAEHGVQIGRRKSVIASRMLLQLTDAPRRMIEVELPEKYLLLDVVCPHAQDWYVIERQKVSYLVIQLDQPRTETIEIGLQGTVPHDLQVDQVTVELPNVPGQARQTTSLGVWFDEIYLAAIADNSNWQSIDPQQLPETIRGLQKESVQFAFRTSQEPDPLRFQLRTAVPEMTADGAILIAVGDATVDYGLTLRWKITQAAADEFAVSVPSWLGRLEFNDPRIRQVRSENIPNGRTRWIISLIEPIQTQYLVTAAATLAIPSNQIIQTPVMDFEVIKPGMAPASLLAQRQFAVLVNLSQRQLISANKVESEKLAVDQLPLHLPADLVRQALEIVRVRPNQPPSWQLQRPAAGIGSQAIVLTAHLTTLLERDGSWRTQAVYGVRNRGQQFLAIRLPDGCNILSVFVRDEASRTVITEHNGQKLHLVALPQTSKADLSFDVKLILSGRFAEPLVVPGDLAGQVHAIPAPQVLTPAESTEFGLPVAQTLWQIELPKELLATPVTGQRTNLTWHKRDDELKSQLQSLERVRQDVAELKRVLADRDLTGSLKQQAQKNLARLGDLLESQQQQASQSGPGKESRFYFDENAKVLDDIQQLKESPPSDRQAGASSISQQRGFVIQNNADFSLLNSTAIPADKDADSKLNFYRADDARRAVLSGKLIAEESESRSRLKEQLKRQLPAVQQALPESSWADSFRRRSNEAKEGSGSGMGGGMGGAFTNGLQAGDESLSSLGVLPNAPRSPANPFTAPFGSTVPDGSVSGVLNAAVPMEGVAASPSELPQRPWGQTGGLSIEMDLPHAERILTFSKIGGGPELALRIRPRAIWLRALGLAWCAGCLLLGAWLLRRSACCWKTAAGEKNAR